MILRGPQFSEQRVPLSKAVPPPVVKQRIDAQPETEIESRRDGLRVVEASRATVPVKSEPAEKGLAFEQVVAWLAVQDVATRNACAAILATEVTRTHEAAKEEGFAAGRAAGEAAAAREIASQLDALKKLHVATEKAFAAEQGHLQDICVDVVAAALTKIAGPILTDESAIVGMVENVLGRVKEGREIVVRVTREDLPLLQKHAADLAAALPGRKLELLPDARVELGGCIVETKAGSLDGRLEVQLRELYETLRLAKAASPELR